MEEYNCPLCGKDVRSDAKTHEFCELCGMGIIASDLSSIFRDFDGKNHIFCYDKCRVIYEEGLNVIFKKEVKIH